MTKTLHELSKEMLNKANVEVLTETGKLKTETPKEVVKEDTDLDESTRKHFQQVADVIKAHPDAAKRKELAGHHSEIFAKQNPRFDKKKFHAASNAELDEGEISEARPSQWKATGPKGKPKGLHAVGKIKGVDGKTFHYDKDGKKIYEGVNGEHGPDDGVADLEEDSDEEHYHVRHDPKGGDRGNYSSKKEYIEKLNGDKIPHRISTSHYKDHIKIIVPKPHAKKAEKLLFGEGVNGEHGPDDDEDQLDRIERKKQVKPPFIPDKKKSTNWTSAKSKANHLARAAMKAQVEKKKVNEDKIKPDSKIKVDGKFVFGNTKGNVAHIDGDKTKKLTKEDDVNELSKETLQKYRDTSSLEIGKAKANKAWAQHDAKRDPSPENYQKQNDAEHAIQKRTKGQELVKKRLEK